MKEATCIHCSRSFAQSPYHKNQSYCKRSECQRAKKADWQRRKMQCDPEYRATQKHSTRKWRDANPGYWKKYREENPEKAERNRLLQRIRNRKKSSKNFNHNKKIAKMDAPKSHKTNKLNTFGQYWLVPIIAKMDALEVNIVKISSTCQ